MVELAASDGEKPMTTGDARDRRSETLCTKVSPAEKGWIDVKRGRQPLSEYLRDLALADACPVVEEAKDSRVTTG
jgi:hypothetical protein